VLNATATGLEKLLTIEPALLPPSGPLTPYMPYNIFGPGTCQVASTTTYMTCPPGGDGAALGSD
jgi:hypothetical protein